MDVHMDVLARGSFGADLSMYGRPSLIFMDVPVFHGRP